MNKHTYQCQKENGDFENVDSIDLSDMTKECNPSLTQLVVNVGASASVLIIVCVMVTVIYRKRWHVRYWLYRTCGKRQPEQPTDNYQYDGFVSYHSDDRWWVHHTLREEMEDKRNLRLFIYLRDMAGWWITR